MPVQEVGKPTSGIHPGIAQRARILDDGALDRVHAAALRTLEQVGIRIDHPEILKLLRGAGAAVEDNLARIPATVVEQAVESAPPRITLYARDPGKNVYLGEGGVHFTSGFGATWVRDLETEMVREATLDDLAMLTRLADALDRVDYVLFAVVPQDVPSHLLDVVCTATVLQHTSKHVQLSLETADWVDEVIEIGRVVVGPGEPVPISAGGVPNSPLHYTADVAEKFMLLGRHNIPCFVVVGAMAGATAPVTLAGALTLQHAEFLAGLVINQLASPGAPVGYGTFSGGFDMRNTKLALGGPEMALLTAATQALADHIGVPVAYATGGMTDSPASDVQAGAEKSFTALSAALAGVDVIHNANSGLLGSGMITSPAQLVIDNDICTSIAHFLRGFEVSEASLAEDVIAAVGPGGNFLATEHTARNFRKTLYLPALRSRNQAPDEVNVTRSVYFDNAAQAARLLLADHQPLPLQAEQVQAIEHIVKEARRRPAHHKEGV